MEPVRIGPREIEVETERWIGAIQKLLEPGYYAEYQPQFEITHKAYAWLEEDVLKSLFFPPTESDEKKSVTFKFGEGEDEITFTITGGATTLAPIAEEYGGQIYVALKGKMYGEEYTQVLEVAGKTYTFTGTGWGEPALWFSKKGELEEMRVVEGTLEIDGVIYGTYPGAWAGATAYYFGEEGELIGVESGYVVEGRREEYMELVEGLGEEAKEKYLETLKGFVEEGKYEKAVEYATTVRKLPEEEREKYIAIVSELAEKPELQEKFITTAAKLMGPLAYTYGNVPLVTKFITTFAELEEAGVIPEEAKEVWIVSEDISTWQEFYLDIVARLQSAGMEPEELSKYISMVAELPLAGGGPGEPGWVGSRERLLVQTYVARTFVEEAIAMGGEYGGLTAEQMMVGYAMLATEAYEKGGTEALTALIEEMGQAYTAGGYMGFAQKLYEKIEAAGIFD